MFASLLLTVFTIVQLNCENLFDCKHDSLKNDLEFCPQGKRQWDNNKYWRKLDNIAQEIAGCAGDQTLPDIVTLCEVENDSVMRDLTKRTSLRGARYEYVMTDSKDARGIDVAIMYNTFSFKLLDHYPLTPNIINPNHPPRDILYAKGLTAKGDTLHIMAVHAPSKYGGKKATETRRMRVAEKIIETTDSILSKSKDAIIIVSGDFNATMNEPSMLHLESQGMTNVTKTAKGRNGSEGSYRYKGKWESIDHILIRSQWASIVTDSYIYDLPNLLEREKKYGGVKPRRSFVGFRFNPNGHSDHLPVVITLDL